MVGSWDWTIRESGEWDSNPQQTDWKSVTLPLSYHRMAYSYSTSSSLYCIGGCLGAVAARIRAYAARMPREITTVATIVAATVEAFIVMDFLKEWYLGWDLNPHVSRRRILNPLRMPIPPPRHRTPQRGESNTQSRGDGFFRFTSTGTT